MAPHIAKPLTLVRQGEVNMSSAFRFQDIFVRGVQDPYPFYHWLRTEAPVQRLRCESQRYEPPMSVCT